MIINNYAHSELTPVHTSGTQKTTVSSVIMSERFLVACSNYLKI